MTASSQSSPVIIEASDRQQLLERVVEYLRAELVADVNATGGMVAPWHVAAEQFEPLPRRMIEAILDLCADHDGACTDIELQGYMETDTGPRAWGTVGLGDASTAPSVLLEGASVVLDQDGDRLRLELHLEREEG